MGPPPTDARAKNRRLIEVPRPGIIMLTIVYLAILLAGFAGCFGLIRLCERL
ncbi:hypothetical protein [Acuticoccus kandeliae]|uniref:hypothetical protein n=1 Tax=Acuticoccus kandeliae TaxID=2073160 RepID=UPI00130066A7|nr:hypothetical protein [Acuticoccus kandeliae]